MQRRRHYSYKEKQHIIHRRWFIVGVITLLCVIFLHLWPIVWFLFCLYLMIELIFWFINWISGGDLDNHPTPPDEPSPEERTMWDIFTLHEMNDHDHFDDHSNDGIH